MPKETHVIDRRKPEAVAPPESEGRGLQTTALVLLAMFSSAAALYFGREFFVPIVFAILLNALFRPVARRMERLHIPLAIGGAVVVLGLFVCIGAAGVALSGPIERWLHEVPGRFSAAQKKLERFRQPVQQVSQVANQLEHVANGPATVLRSGTQSKLAESPFSADEKTHRPV